MLQSVSSVFVVYRRKTLTGSPDPAYANGTKKPCTNYPKSFQFYTSPNSLNPTATLLSRDCGSLSSFNQYVSMKVYCNPRVITPHFSTLLVLLRISSLCPTDIIHNTVRSLEWPFLTDCVTPRFEYRDFPW